jgi:hypothetical protein
MRQQVDQSSEEKSAKTLEDLLKSADESQDPRVRVIYQYRAAEMAYKAKDYIRALKILDSIDQDGRKFMGGSWESYRWQWADDQALELFKRGDVSQMRQVIGAIPPDIKPFGEIGFVARLPEARDKTIDPTLEFLSNARKGLAKSTVPESEKSTWYMGLLKFTVKYQSGDAQAVLREMIDNLNHATQEKNSLIGDARLAFLQSISRGLPASLIELDEYVVNDAVGHIDSPDVRVQIRLNLLGACLTRMTNLKQDTNDKGQSTSKGE